jgi:hypothetical protein
MDSAIRGFFHDKTNKFGSDIIRYPRFLTMILQGFNSEDNPTLTVYFIETLCYTIRISNELKLFR